MVRRPHSRAFPRSVTAPAPVAATPIVACGPSARAHERPRSFRKGLVDVFVPSEARVSKKKQKQRERRRKHAQQAQHDRQQTADDKGPLCTYGTFVDAPPPRPVCAPPLRPAPEAHPAPTVLTEVCLDDEQDDEQDDEYDILSAADVPDGTLVHAPVDEPSCVIC